jgi:predicted nucleic acid-binding protein
MIDTGVFLAAVLTRDAHHQEAIDVLRDVDAGRYRGHTTNFVLAEAFNFVTARVDDARVAEALFEIAFGSPRRDAIAVVHQIHGGRLAAALDRYRREFRAGLSLTDWTTLVVMADQRIAPLATFDRGFRGRVPTVPG